MSEVAPSPAPEALVERAAQELRPELRCVIVIPVFNHAGRVEHVVQRALALGWPLIVVDDGSTDGSCDSLEGLDGVTLLRHETNRGKGAALLTGFATAAQEADWAVTLDADGQHDPADVPALLAAIPEGQRPLVIGCRRGMDGPDTPWTSRFGRGFSNFWIWVSGGHLVADSQSGFRAYPLPETLQLGARARRFQFEVEILVRARWKRVPVAEAPVSVDYAPFGRRVSHFRPFVDFWRNSATFTRLIAHRLLVPWFLRARRSEVPVAVR